MVEAEQLTIKNSKLRILEYLTLVSRLVLGVVFILAGLAKLGLPAAMAASITSYEMPLPSGLVNVMANVMPALELGVGVWLLLGLFTRYAAGVSGLLLLVFTIAIGQAWARGLQINCGCFGGPDVNPIGKSLLDALGPVGTFLTHETAGPETLLRDIVMLLMSVHLILVPTPFSLDELRRRQREREVVEEDAVFDEELPA